MTDVRPSVVLIHGMYLNPQSWNPWIGFAGARGYEAHAPAWPFHDGWPADLRRTIDPGLGRLTFGDVVAAFRTFIASLPTAPYLIGHSVGGLVVQKLANEGIGRAAVSICPAPPQGVLSFSPNFWRSNWPHVSPRGGTRPIEMTPARFHQTFCNTTTRADSDAAFDAYVVPESRQVPRSSLVQGRIRFGRPHAPLLLMAAELDHLTPAAMVAANAKRYARRGRAVSLRTFTGRSHFACNQRGWEELAKAAFDWIDTAAAAECEIHPVG